jgi:hypothetical protein
MKQQQYPQNCSAALTLQEMEMLAQHTTSRHSRTRPTKAFPEILSRLTKGLALKSCHALKYHVNTKHYSNPTIQPLGTYSQPATSSIQHHQVPLSGCQVTTPEAARSPHLKLPGHHT